MKHCNYCLLFLSVFVISDITSGTGKNSVSRTAEEANTLVGRFVSAFKEYMSTEVKTPELIESSKNLGRALKESQVFKKDISTYSVFDDLLANLTCHEAVQYVLDVYREEDNSLVVLSAKYFCNLLNLSTNKVCEGLIEFNSNAVEYIISNSEIDSNTVCSLIIKGSAYQPSEEYNIQIEVDQSKAMPTENKKGPVNKTANLKILHISDFHYDPLYVPGALAECEEPLCCSRQVEEYNKTEKGAGYWSDYRNCDTPLHLIDNVLNHIKNTHKNIDLIYHTGDIVDHQVWTTSKAKNSKSIATIMNRIKTIFPDIPMYSCVGNHEPHPLNLFSPPDVPKNINTNWLYRFLYQFWKPWLPAEASTTIFQGGYYTALVRPGLRVISINSNECYIFNWWLFYSGDHQKTQLQWMHDTLLEAERNGEHVHILSHVPSGDGSCWDVWAREYNRIIARFSDTIGALFNGHSHNDEMTNHYTLDNVAFAMSWNGGSLTTFDNRNPNYRVLHVENNTMQVVDHETWFFNLTEANLSGGESTPNWQQEYRFSEAFTDDLSPDGIDILLEKLASDPELLFKLWRFRSKLGDATLKEGCDTNCMGDFLCRMSRSVNSQERRCYELKRKFTDMVEKPQLEESEVPESEGPESEEQVPEEQEPEEQEPEEQTSEESDESDESESGTTSYSVGSVLLILILINMLP